MSGLGSSEGTARQRPPRTTRPRNLAIGALIDRLPTRRPCACLDYDGTLVPMAPRPDLAFFDAPGRELLRALGRQMPVAIVSGRARSTLRSLVRVRGLVYVGNHGLEIAGPGISHVAKPHRNWHIELERMVRAIESSAPPGVLIERKGLTASVHYRLVKGATRPRWVRRTATRLASWCAANRVHVVRGKAVFELRPLGGWDKGHAVRWLLSQPAWRNRTPVYLGDDTTDEDAFEAIRSNGIGVLVGPSRMSAARYRVPNWAAARTLLQRWLVAISAPHDS